MKTAQRKEFRKATITASNDHMPQSLMSPLERVARSLHVTNCRKPDILAIRSATYRNPQAFMCDIHPVKAYPK